MSSTKGLFGNLREGFLIVTYLKALDPKRKEILVLGAKSGTEGEQITLEIGNLFSLELFYRNYCRYIFSTKSSARQTKQSSGSTSEIFAVKIWSLV